MKKILAILLCLIMVVATAVPVFAADPGTKVSGTDTQNDDKKPVCLWNYASDEVAVQNGAIARLDNTNGTKYYAKDLQTIFGFGGNATYNSSGRVTMLVSEYNSNWQDTTDGRLRFWGRTFTIYGGENGCTINTPTRFRLDGSTGVLTFENITINITSGTSGMGIQLHPDCGKEKGSYTKVVFKNSTVKSADDVTLQHGLIVLNLGTTLTLDTGAKLITTKALTSTSYGTTENCGVRLNADNTKVILKTGSEISSIGYGIIHNGGTNTVTDMQGGTIKAKKDGIYGTAAGSTITVSGGSFDTTGSAIVPVGANSTVNITGGTFNLKSAAVWTAGTATVNISGGTFNTTATSSVRTITIKSKATVNVTGGTFKTASDYIFLINAVGASVKVTNGTFEATNGAIFASASNNTQTTVEGGTFTAKKELYFVNNAADGTSFTMTGGTSTTGTIANIGLNKADARGNGEDSVTFSGTANCTATGSTGFQLSDINSTITINGGTYSAPNGRLICFADTATGNVLKITDGNFSAGGVWTDTDLTPGTVIWSWVGVNVTIDGGYFYTETGKAIMRLNVAGSTVVVNGGTFEHHGADAILQITSSTMTVNGGKYIASDAFGMIISNGDNCLVTVNGGDYYSVAKGAHTGARGVFRHHSKNAVLIVNNATVYGAPVVFASTSNDATASTLQGGNVAIKPSAMVTGAAVRTAKDSSGIRFQSKLDKTVVDAIAAIDADYVIGTLIVPYDYLVDGEGNTVCEFSKAALDKAGKQYLNIVAKDGINDMGTYYLINAAMKNISEANYDRDFVAVAYITYKTANGTITIYSAWNEKNNVRNIEEVAYMALDDVVMIGDTVKNAEGEEVELTAENAYELGYNLVTSWYEYDKETGAATLTTGTAYTEYSAAQREVFEKYIGKANA